VRIAVFGHDAGHANLVRRIDAFQSLGHSVHGLTMRRGPDTPRSFPNTDLGRTFDDRFAQRVAMIGLGTYRARCAARPDEFDLLWARNLDMLATALAFRGKFKVPVVYETLDIHRSLSGENATARFLRQIEGRLLRHVSLIVVSAPAFVTEYYDRHHPDHPPVALVENTLPLGDMPPRPGPRTAPNEPFVLGWTGILRCRRSLDVLAEVAHRLEGRVLIRIHGRPALRSIPDFHERVAADPYLDYRGPYRSPEDLPSLYGEMDAVWCGVYYQSEGNAKWLLPNRVYEAGYFGLPALAPPGTQTAAFIAEHGLGPALRADTAEALAEAATALMDARAYGDSSERIAAQPTRLFARGTEDVAAALAMAARS
jgi:succinoglycan biosynthesis protein ExoL